MSKIRKITQIDVVNWKSVFLGDLINEVPIHSFEDKSIELNSGSIESLYLAKDVNGDVVLSIEKCPVIVYYKNEDFSLPVEYEDKEFPNIDAIEDIPPLEDDTESVDHLEELDCVETDRQKHVKELVEEFKNEAGKVIDEIHATYDD